MFSWLSPPSLFFSPSVERLLRVLLAALQFLIQSFEAGGQGVGKSLNCRQWCRNFLSFTPGSAWCYIIHFLTSVPEVLWLPVPEKVKQCLHEACKVPSVGNSVSLGLATAAQPLWWQSYSSEDDLFQTWSAASESSRGNWPFPDVSSIHSTQNVARVCYLCKKQSSMLCRREYCVGMWQCLV